MWVQKSEGLYVEPLWICGLVFFMRLKRAYKGLLYAPRCISLGLYVKRLTIKENFIFAQRKNPRVIIRQPTSTVVGFKNRRR